MRSKNAREVAASLGQMPPDCDGADTKERRDRRDGQAFELVHDEDGAATWRQPVERTPDRRPGDEDGFLIARHTGGTPRLFLVPSSNGRFSPLVAPKVDEDADQPRFLVCPTDWNGRDRACSLEECVLDEIPRSIGGGNKAPRQAVARSGRRRAWTAGRPTGRGARLAGYRRLAARSYVGKRPRAQLCWCLRTD